MSAKASLTILFHMIVCTCFAQHIPVELTFISDETQEPIEGMSILIRSQVNNENYSGITNEQGKLLISHLQLPLEIKSRHIGFDNFQAIVSVPGQAVFTVTPSVKAMKDLVVETRQYQGVALDPDLYTVEKIERKEIDQLGGSNLADVLNYQMNIAIMPDAATGRSTVSMFGLSGEYVKILVDNMPIASDNGSGNNIDITQIGLQNIARIEVAEGAMGVRYGSNAVAGVINVVTQKTSDSKWRINATLQEESIGKEYDWSEQGRHIQNLSVSHKFSDKLYTTLGYQHNTFSGYFNGYKGKDHTASSTPTEKERGYEWNPKQQHSLQGIASYQFTDATSLYYKYEHYNEQLDIYDRIVNSSIGLGDIPAYTATDEQFLTRRNSHQLTLTSAHAKGMDLNVLLSYQKQERQYEDYTYDINRKVKKSTRGLHTNQSSDVFFSKTTVDGLLYAFDRASLSVGIETEYQKGYDATASGNYSDSIAIQTLAYYDAFANLTLFPQSKLTLTPGLRLNHNSHYGNHLIWSFTANYAFTEKLTTKLVLGSAYKTPGYPELFRYFVDANHDVTGNPDLVPEDGISILWTITKTSQFGDVKLINTLKGYHFNIKDKITLSTISEQQEGSPAETQRSTYLNIDTYKSIGLSTDNRIVYKNLTGCIGMEYLGVQQSLNTVQSDGYAFRWNARSQLGYDIPKPGISLSWNLKYNGGGERYFETEDGVYKGNIKGFTLMDASLSKSFFSKSLTTTFGARNLLNVVTINATGLPGGAHGGSSPAPLLFANGRSFYLRLVYDLHIN